jgi:purine-nucleoside phosphorylase
MRTLHNSGISRSRISGVGTEREQVLQTLFGSFAESFRAQYAGTLDAVIIAGSGLSDIMAHHELIIEINMLSIPNFPIPAVQGHGHTIRILRIHEKHVAFVSGRCHLYEGHPMIEAVAAIGMLSLCGATHLVITNSAGGLDHHYAVGDIMIATDFLNMMSTPVLSALGIVEPRHGVVSHISASWLERIIPSLVRQGEGIHRGIYAGVLGPSYETPAEIRMLRLLGGNAVGMSTVHEAEFAHWCGFSTVSCSLISNLLKETSTDLLSHHDVVIAAKIGATRTARFVEEAIRAIL